MKNMKKILALALVVMSVMAIALPAMAAGWESHYGPGELNSNSNYAGVHRHVRNLQKDLIKLGYACYFSDSQRGELHRRSDL